MAKIHICDRCGEELEVSSFDTMFSDFSGIEMFGKNCIDLPQLCKRCSKEFEKIIEKFNEETQVFLTTTPKKKKFLGMFQ